MLPKNEKGEIKLHISQITMSLVKPGFQVSLSSAFFKKVEIAIKIKSNADFSGGFY